MPGPCNVKKKRKQQSLKDKKKLQQMSLTVSEDQEDTLDGKCEQQNFEDAEEVKGVDHYYSTAPSTLKEVPQQILVEQQARLLSPVQHVLITPKPNTNATDKPPPIHTQPETRDTSELTTAHARSTISRTDAATPQTDLESPFISDPGNGPRVKDARAFLASFFCPPPSLEDESCAAFARMGVLHVLEAVLPMEVALIVWFNKTRKYRRICPACQRLYRLGDALADPISGEPVDVYDPQTPPQVLREQQISGICSAPCFLLASYTSHPYVAEVARGAWGARTHELAPATRALLDTTDPATAALLRYGIDAWEMDSEVGPESGKEKGKGMGDLGLGRVMRLTRSWDMGLGEVLMALKWAEEGGEREVARLRMENEGEGEGRERGGGPPVVQRTSGICAPVGIRA